MGGVKATFCADEEMEIDTKAPTSTAYRYFMTVVSSLR